MSLYKDASLVMIPSAVKDGKLYSIRPTDGSGDFTFSRGSNLAATRVDVNGLIEKGRENLLLQSNQFDTTWLSVNNATLTSGQSGYDGTNDAWKLNIQNAFSGFLRQNLSSSNVNSFSVYAKADTLDWIRVSINGAVNASAYFDIANGVAGSSISSVDTSVVSVGNDWYRVTLVTNDSAITAVRIYGADDDGVLGVGGSVYIQDAQLEKSMVATDYIETGATTAQSGILEDLPRLDYSGGASCPSLLLEPQRTNLMVHSELLSSFGGTATINENSIVSPEGVQNAAEVVLSSSGTDSFYKEANVTASSKYTLSFYVKQGSNTNNELAVRNQTNASFIATDISYTASPTEWKRIDYTFTTPSGCTEVRIYPHRSSSSSVGNGYFYGVQLEQGSYPTSYIPTYGSAVTRSNDSCQRTGATDLLGQEQGVIFLDFTYKPVFDDAAGQSTYRFSISNNTYSNRVIIYPNNSNQLNILANGVVFTGSAYSLTEGQRYKVALAYGETSVCYINGVEAFGYGSGTPVGAYSQIQFSDAINASTRTWTSPVHQALIFPTRLTNAELAALTA